MPNCPANGKCYRYLLLFVCISYICYLAGPDQIVRMLFVVENHLDSIKRGYASVVIWMKPGKD